MASYEAESENFKKPTGWGEGRGSSIQWLQTLANRNKTPGGNKYDISSSGKSDKEIDLGFLSLLSQISPGIAIGGMPAPVSGVGGGLHAVYERGDRQKEGIRNLQSAEYDAQQKRELELAMLRAQLAKLTERPRAETLFANGDYLARQAGIQDFRDSQDRAFSVRERNRNSDFEQKRRKLELEQMQAEIERMKRAKEMQRKFNSTNSGYNTEVINDAGLWRTIRTPWEKRNTDTEETTTNWDY